MEEKSLAGFFDFEETILSSPSFIKEIRQDFNNNSSFLIPNS